MNRFSNKVTVFRLIPLLLLILFIVGCQREEKPGSPLAGRVILWHGWSPTEASVLEDALREFQEINPDVQIIEVPVSSEDLFPRFEQAGSEGTGPDLLIGFSEWIQPLADANLIRPIPNSLLGSAFSQTRIAVTYEDQIYGLPLSMAPYALYYNKSLVTSPAVSLDELLEHAADGHNVAFVPRFQEAYWGIQASGTDMFDSEGNLSLADSGFVPWLEWLSLAQNEPGVILNVDDAALLDLFTQSEIAYYVAGPEIQAELEAIMEPDGFGVTTLPAGPNGAAGPLLPVESILIYSYAASEQVVIAEALAKFLTNQQQGIRFMRELARVPANPVVAVDSRIYPNVSGFSRQARSAVVVPPEYDMDQLEASGSRAYANVLSGALPPEAAVCLFGQEVAAAQGLGPERVTLPPGCTLTGEE